MFVDLYSFFLSRAMELQLWASKIADSYTTSSHALSDSTPLLVSCYQILYLTAMLYSFFLFQSSTELQLSFQNCWFVYDQQQQPRLIWLNPFVSLVLPDLYLTAKLSIAVTYEHSGYLGKRSGLRETKKLWDISSCSSTPTFSIWL